LRKIDTENTRKISKDAFRKFLEKYKDKPLTLNPFSREKNFSSAYVYELNCNNAYYNTSFYSYKERREEAVKQQKNYLIMSEEAYYENKNKDKLKHKSKNKYNSICDEIQEEENYYVENKSRDNNYHNNNSNSYMNSIDYYALTPEAENKNEKEKLSQEKDDYLNLNFNKSVRSSFCENYAEKIAKEQILFNTT